MRLDTVWGKRQNKRNRTGFMKITNQDYKILPYTLESTVHAVIFFFFNLKAVLQMY